MKEVVLGYDYDLGGRRSFERNKKAIEAAFSGLKVTTIDEFVPAEVKAVLPSSKPQDYKEDGDYYECKRDMNDILLQPGIKEKYAYDMQEKTIPF